MTYRLIQKKNETPTLTSITLKSVYRRITLKSVYRRSPITLKSVYR